ncbi:hypothetical protein [Clostridium tunisiense]|uniref:hypothetical protein n=1 Tax=Clostridium tunisiense TaxID=219748 RepID=UPI0002D65CED|nr:hypothetical protein [Clostridium tunisiense]
MTILIHRSTMRFRKNIIKEGLTWRYRSGIASLNDIKSENDVSTNEINFILNQYKPYNKYPSNQIDRHKCIFMTLKDDNIPTDNYRDLLISIDSNFLDYKKLFVAPFILVNQIVYGLIEKYSVDKLDLIAKHYWNNCFSFSDYINNQKIINNVFERVYNIKYIPEVLYMSEIDPNCFEVI